MNRVRHRKSTSRLLTAALAVSLIAATVGIELLTGEAAGAGITTFTGSGQVSHPDGIVAGPDGALVVHGVFRQPDRTHRDHRDGSVLQ